jgi:ketosteroid isomerase-like protein
MSDTRTAADETAARVADRIELSDLVHRYAMAVDDRDFETLRDVYAEEATFVGRTASPVGREAVIEYLRTTQATNGVTVHCPTSQLVTFEGPDRASGVVVSSAQLDIEGDMTYLVFRYYDDYVRRDGRWQFARRELRNVHPLPVGRA